MNIILRLICENFSRIAIIIGFLWGHEHGVYAAASCVVSVMSCYLSNNLQNFTSVYLFMNIVYIAQ